MTIDQVNALCVELAAEAAEANMDALIDELEQEELDSMMLALGPEPSGQMLVRTIPAGFSIGI